MILDVLGPTDMTMSGDDIISCFHPMIAFPNKVTANGKVQYMPVKVSDDEFKKWFDKSSIEYIKNNNSDDIYKPIMIPCGRCIGCRLDYSREWAARCMLELKDHDEAWFVTLTYSDERAPRAEFISDDGEKLKSLTLCKRHWQLFMKRLRNEFPNDKLRFYMCGEYGSNTLRPHYHAIIFGLHLPKYDFMSCPDGVKFYKRTDTGILYNCDKVSKCWTEYDSDLKVNFSRGYVVLANVTWNTCAYVARYTAKKEMTFDNEFWSKFNMEPPFVLMSRRPGIGYNYLEKNKELFDSDSLFIPKEDGVESVSIPRYYYKCLERSDPTLCEQIKRQRKQKMNVFVEAQIMAHDRSYSDRVKDAEKVLIEKAKVLTREI